MVSWKHSFDKLNEEYLMAKKKGQALDALLESGKISKSTHNLFTTEIAEAITEIERQQKVLVQKMNAKMMELAEQTKILEILLTNIEIQHVTGEVDDAAYEHQINVLSVGLETAKNELNRVKEAIDNLSVDNAPAADLEAEAGQEESKSLENSEESRIKREKTEQHEDQQPLEEAIKPQSTNPSTESE